jgi:hypothetical protein
LKFRIEENQNDTGWVEKLANVGSEGTDVLVKAMINIMLLNVFKEGASKRFKDFRLHCMMDEIGKLHPNNVKEFYSLPTIEIFCLLMVRQQKQMQWIIDIFISWKKMPRVLQK